VVLQMEMEHKDIRRPIPCRRPVGLSRVWAAGVPQVVVVVGGGEGVERWRGTLPALPADCRGPRGGVGRPLRVA